MQCGIPLASPSMSDKAEHCIRYRHPREPDQNACSVQRHRIVEQLDLTNGATRQRKKDQHDGEDEHIPSLP